eukprot:2605259-Rhodomonas_salina.4
MYVVPIPWPDEQPPARRLAHKVQEYSPRVLSFKNEIVDSIRAQPEHALNAPPEPVERPVHR